MSQHFPRLAGVALPLFSLRGEADLGSGTILDLVPFADWLVGWHQRVVQLLPINETAPGETSPYNTVSAFAIDPTYISALHVVDVQRSSAAQDWLRSGRTLSWLRRLQRSARRERRAAYSATLRLLELGFQEFTALPPASDRAVAFERFRAANAWWLDAYALFRALKERYRWRNWETWPEPLRTRRAAALQQAAVALRPRVRFLQYLQWIADEQWGVARRQARARGLLIKGDLPFVCGRDSADVWAHPELFDLASSAGAPPDAFSQTGQAWGLPLYNWPAIRRSNYDWWRRRARQAGSLYDLFRVDHVVGLYRTYAIPVSEGGSAGFLPADETEQRTQGNELLSALLAEAGPTAGVIAEDLGTVPPWVRASLTVLGVPGYKVLRWEQHDGTYIDPRAYPVLSVATTGTHDTETLLGWWEGLQHHERANVVQSLDLVSAGCDAQDPSLEWTPSVHLALLRRLYESGSALIILPFQDLFGWRERINVPATTNAENWTFRLPVGIADLDDTPAIRERMEAIRAMTDQTGRDTPPTCSG